jgi:hypothetical protein
VLVAVSADVRRGLVRGAVVVTQLVTHGQRDPVLVSSRETTVVVLPGVEAGCPVIIYGGSALLSSRGWHRREE